MTLLSKPVRRVTDTLKRDSGFVRPIVISLYPRYVEVRLKGTRRPMQVSYEAVYDMAAKQAARAARIEREEKRKQKGVRP